MWVSVFGTRNSRVMVVAPATLLVSAGHESRATFSGEPGLIAFVRQGPHAGIYTIDPSGTDLTRLTTGQGYRPGWSTNGMRIVFTWFDEPYSHLWLMNAPDGSNLKPLVATEGSGAAWSPAGTQIVT